MWNFLKNNRVHILSIFVLSMTAKCFGQSNTITAQWRDSSGHIVRERIVPSKKYPSEFKLDGKVGIIVYTVGEVIADPNYDEIFFNSDGNPSIYVIDSMRGYLDVRTGAEITPPIYKLARHFNEDRAAVSLDGKKMGYIDTTGQMVIAPQWDLVSDFYQGMAKVVLADDLSMMYMPDLHRVAQVPTPGKAGFIDREGYYIILPEYAFIDINQGEPYLRFTRGPYDPAGGQGYDLKKAYPNSKWGLMDLRGKVIIPDSLYDFIFQVWIEDHYLYGVEKAGRYSVLDPVTWQPVVRWKKYDSPEELVEAYEEAVYAYRYH